jgi:hypothetical protein
MAAPTRGETMLTMKLLWSIPAALFATFLLIEGGVQLGQARGAARTQAQAVRCASHEVAVDLDGDGRAEEVRLVHVGDDAWADVWAGATMRSTTRVGAWRDDDGVEAIDVNGDGKIDLVRRWNEGPEQHAQVWVSDGLAFNEGWSGVTGNTCVAQR